MQESLQDLRYAFRGLSRRPVAGIVVMLTIAIVIGAASAIYGLVRATLIEPLPVPEPDRLLTIRKAFLVPERFETSSHSYPDFVDLRERNEVFRDLAAFTAPKDLLVRRGDLELLATGVLVSANYFSTLGVALALGQGFPATADQPPGDYPMAILGHDLWRRAFDGDPAVLGEEIRINDHPFTIVGVAPRGFRGTTLGIGPGLWVPLSMHAQVSTGFAARMEMSNRGWDWLRLVARLAPEATSAQAIANLQLLTAQLEQAELPSAVPRKLELILEPTTVTATGVESREELGRFLKFLLLAALSALLIACANIANLMAARTAQDRRQFGVRLALGAGRHRVVRQILLEGLVLALAGGALGLLVAVGTMRLMGAFELPGEISVAALGLGLDPRVVGVTTALSIVTGLLFAAPAALYGARIDPSTVLEYRGSLIRSGHRHLGSGLIALQVGLCFVLLIGGGLFVRGIRSAVAVDPGFEKENVLLASVNLGLQRYSAEDAAAFFQRSQDRLRSLGEVRAAAWAVYPPLASSSWRESGALIEGYRPPPGQSPTLSLNFVGKEYFDALGIAVENGRGFDDRDGAGAPQTAVVNQTAARTFWDSRRALGSTIGFEGADGPRTTVVGVVPDTKYQELDEDPVPFVYLSFDQTIDLVGLSGVTLVVKTTGPPERAAPAVRQVLREVAPRAAVFDIRTMEEQVDALLRPQRMAAVVVGALGLLALTLASIGIYGMVSYSLVQRTFEIGVRSALGADRGLVVRTMMIRGLAPALVGAAGGLAAAWPLGRLLSGFLYGIGELDPMTLLLTMGLLTGSAVVASYLPARHAAHIQPAVALREA
jgi:predicted permease